ncbi:hypothetical protein Tco_0607911 [Tanacetum coccineum]
MPIVSYYVAPYEPAIPFPRCLEQHAEEALVHKTMESLKRIKVNRPLLKEIRKTYDYAKHIKYLVENKSRTSKNEDVKMNTRCSVILQNQLPPKEQDLRIDFVILDMVEDLTIPIIIGRTLLATAYAKVDVLKKMISLEVGNQKEEIDYRCSMLDQEEPWEVETVKEPKHDIDLSSVVNQKFTGTIHDEDDLDGIADFLELKSHDDFVDINDEAYKERMCKLLGMTYKKPSPILIEKVEVTRAELMEEMDTGGSVQRKT